jgi:anti-sigma regulatory factor (Ser/Thr protein kinase)
VTTTAGHPGPAARPPEQRYTLTFGQVTETTPAQFRRALNTLLGLWGLGELIDDAHLVATELLTNVYRHTDRRCEIVLLTNASGAHLQVRDYSTAMPRTPCATPDGESGRGILAVEHYAGSCHIHPLPDGKTISVFLPLPPGPAAGPYGPAR